MLSTFKHTPGPWHCERQTPDAWGTAIGEPIAVIGGEATGEPVEFIVGRCCDWGPHGATQTEANAYLIAAAPDLLEACQAMVSDCRVKGLAMPSIQVAEAAIAKAKIGR